MEFLYGVCSTQELISFIPLIDKQSRILAFDEFFVVNSAFFFLVKMCCFSLRYRCPVKLFLKCLRGIRHFLLF